MNFFCMYTTLGKGQEMTLTFNTHIYSYILPGFRSLAAIVSEISSVFTFSYRKTFVTKFDLAVKLVEVTRGSSFEQPMMGWCHQCYIPSFMEIGLPVAEKMIFEGFFLYMGVAAILVM